MNMSQRDRRRVWHPYSSPEPSPLFEVVAARGVRLELADGRELIDGMSSWWAAIHGYRHPAIEKAVGQQSGRMPHVMFGGLTHEPAVSLCERLVEHAPGNFERVFLPDSGSVAVEVAIKIALQSWVARGQAGRQRLLTARGGYHGDDSASIALVLGRRVEEIEQCVDVRVDQFGFGWTAVRERFEFAGHHVGKSHFVRGFEEIPS